MPSTRTAAPPGSSGGQPADETTAVDAAVAYAKLDVPVFPAVADPIPEGRDDKEPLYQKDIGAPHPFWTRTSRLWGATTDVNAIRRHWPTEGAGVAIAPHHVVLDGDVPKASTCPLPLAERQAIAQRRLQQLVERFPELATAPLAETPSGGWHLHFAWPDDQPKPGASKWPASHDPKAENVDERPWGEFRGSGKGYVLAWPSTIEGDAYVWHRPFNGQLPTASPELVEFLTRPREGAASMIGEGTDERRVSDPTDTAKKVLTSTRDNLGRVKEARNDATYKAARFLGRWLGGYAAAGLDDLLTEEHAWDALIEANQKNGDWTDGPNAERKCRGTIRRGLRDGMATPFVVKVVDPDAGRPPPISDEELAAYDAEVAPRDVGNSPAKPPTSKPHAPRVTIFSAAELASRELPPLRPVVADMIVPGLNVFAGPYKLGKSWLVLQMAHSVATNTRFFNRDVHPGRAIVFSLEDGERRLKGRLERQGIDARHLDLLMFSTELPKLDKGGLAELEHVLDRYSDTRMIVIDTWTRFKPRATNSGNAYDQDSEHGAMLQRLALDRDIALVLVTHVRKMPAEDPFDMITGSVGLHGTADSLIMLARKRGESDGVLRVTARDLGEREDALTFDPQTGTWTMLGSAQEYAQTTQRRLIIQAVRTLSGLGMSTGPKAVADQLDGEVSANTVRQLMPRMLADGTLRSPTRGTYMVAEDALKRTGQTVDNVAFVAKPLPYRED